MEPLKLFLGKFKNFLPPEVAVRGLVKEVIKKHTGIELKNEEVQVTNFTIYIKTRPIKKSEIFIKREHILSDLEKLVLNLRRPPRGIV